jgi:hypothetical protein
MPLHAPRRQKRKLAEIVQAKVGALALRPLSNDVAKIGAKRDRFSAAVGSH